MEWLRQLQGQIVGLDTAPLIYFIEQHPDYLERVRAFFTALDAGDFRVITSSLTLTEVLVHPLRSGYTDLAENIFCIERDCGSRSSAKGDPKPTNA